MKMKADTANRWLSRLVWLVTLVLTLRVVVWFFEQRAHDKEYWLIFAHVIPFLLVIFTSAVILFFIKNWAFRRFGPLPADDGGSDGPEGNDG